MKVKVTIESTIENLDANGLMDGDAEKSSTTVNGIYHYLGGDATLSYNETGEGGRSLSEIEYRFDAVRVRRSGAIESELYFKEGESHSSVYSIPPYRFDATVSAKRVRAELTESGGNIDLLYTMKIGGAEKRARMKIWIFQPLNQN